MGPKKFGGQSMREDREEAEAPEETSGGGGPDALEAMHQEMKAGNYKLAFDALKAAVNYCKGEE